MKLRIQGDSIRLRLTQSEVARFSATGRVADAVHVGPGRLEYALVAAEQLGAEFDGATLAVSVPRAWAAAWADTDEVGTGGALDLGDGRRLALLIEKDFECLHRRPDEDDAFPHPLADAG